MTRNVASLHRPIVSTVGFKVQKATARHVVFGIHQVKVAISRVHNDAIGHGDCLQLRCRKQVGINDFMGPYIDKPIADVVCCGGIVPCRTIII